MKPVILREYDYLISESDGTIAGRQGERVAKGIPRKAFVYLGRLLSKDESREQSDDHSFFLKRTSWHGKAAFQVQSFVGVLQTPCGTQIEILPKTAKADDDNDHQASRRMLVRMLRHLRDANFKLGGDVHLKHDKMHLLELFMGYFLREVNQLVKQGIRSDYITREENQMFLKGKLLVSQQIRVNAIQQQRFYVAFDEYLPDRPENRLLHAALEKVSRLTRTANNQRLCRELEFVFADVPVSRDIPTDFSKCKFNRAMIHYRHALEWCRMILRGESAVPSAGKTQAISILFPMEKVFEDYVGWLLGRDLSVSCLKLQTTSKWLLEHPKKFQMRPDFMFKMSSSDTVVGDAKWKLIDADSSDGKLGVSQADLYQLYAYGHKYLNGKGQLILFYPETDRFKKVIRWTFEDNLEIMLIPVPLSVESKSQQKNVDLDRFLSQQNAQAQVEMLSESK